MSLIKTLDTEIFIKMQRKYMVINMMILSDYIHNKKYAEIENMENFQDQMIIYKVGDV